MTPLIFIPFVVGLIGGWGLTVLWYHSVKIENEEEYIYDRKLGKWRKL